jgi:hypothetical protein
VSTGAITATTGAITARKMVLMAVMPAGASGRVRPAAVRTPN